MTEVGNVGSNIRQYTITGQLVNEEEKLYSITCFTV